MRTQQAVDLQAEAVRLHEQGRNWAEIGRALGVTLETAHCWVDPAYWESKRARKRRSDAKQREAVRPVTSITPPQAFTRAYRRALAEGIDLLEARDAAWECSECHETPFDGHRAGCKEDR